MSTDNRVLAQQIMQLLEKWDAEKQLQATQNIDPYDAPNDGYRSGAIAIG
jgi:hypothetical protein